MTIERLTEDERVDLSNGDVSDGPKVLRIIDALVDAMATAEQGVKDAWGAYHVADERAFERNAQLTRAEAECAALRARLEASRDETGIAQRDAKALRAELAEALRWKEMNQAEGVALRAELNRQVELSVGARNERDELRAEVERLGADLVVMAKAHDNASNQRDAALYVALPAAESSLAAATELLEWLASELPGAYRGQINAFLAAQPAATKPPNERSEAERAALFPCLEKLSNALCQTQGHILRALEQSGLSVVLSAQPAAPARRPDPREWTLFDSTGQPAAPAYGSSPVGGANLRPEHRPTIAELIAATEYITAEQAAHIQRDAEMPRFEVDSDGVEHQGEPYRATCRTCAAPLDRQTGRYAAPACPFGRDPCDSCTCWQQRQPAAPCDHAGAEVAIDRATGEETCQECGKPAAPARTEHACEMGIAPCPQCFPTRTEAEQRVLKAIGRIPRERFEHHAQLVWLKENRPEDYELAVAELARREAAKKGKSNV